jgi:hypothetical protein
MVDTPHNKNGPIFLHPSAWDKLHVIRGHALAATLQHSHAYFPNPCCSREHEFVEMSVWHCHDAEVVFHRLDEDGSLASCGQQVGVVEVLTGTGDRNRHQVFVSDKGAQGEREFISNHVQIFPDIFHEHLPEFFRASRQNEVNATSPDQVLEGGQKRVRAAGAVVSGSVNAPIETSTDIAGNRRPNGLGSGNRGDT